MAERDLLERCRSELPRLFAVELARLEEQAKNGDPALRARLEQMSEEPVLSLLRIEGQGGGELVFRAGRDGLQLANGAPSQAFGYAVAVEVAWAKQTLELLERGGAEVEEATRALTLLASRSARELFSEVGFGFELVVTDMPVLGVLGLRLSLGRPAFPARPEFKLTVSFDELEDAHAEGIAPHQLFLAGKIRIDGDVAKAMLLGMTLAQLR